MFEVGKFYCHQAGRRIAILGEVQSYKWGRMLVIEEVDSTGHSISCAEIEQEPNDNWTEIGKPEWIMAFTEGAQ